jgi:predicted ATP-grasp superfamily ATP-dependent carboligase
VDLTGYLDRLPFERAVLIASADSWVRRVANLGPEITPRFPSSVAPWSVLAQLMDKGALLQSLSAAGVPHPWTESVTTVSDLAALPDSAFAGSFLKPTDSEAFLKRYGVKAFHVESRAEAVQRMTDLESIEIPMLLQDYIPGPPSNHYFIDGFIDRGGRTLACFARQRLRMFPADFGNSTFMQSIPVSEVAEAADSLARLLHHVNYRGVFSAEFKLDERDGVYKMLEVNVRPWWYIDFAARCGVDISYLAYLDALGRELEPIVDYRVGVQLIYPHNDYFSYRALHRKGMLSHWAWIRSWLDSTQPVFQWGDPLPAAWEFGQFVKSRFKSRRPYQGPERRRYPRDKPKEQAKVNEQLLYQSDSGLKVRLLRHPDPERQRCEREILESGIPMPLPSRNAWADVLVDAKSWFLAIEDPRTGRCRGGFALLVDRSRAVPGHLLLRAERIGSNLPPVLQDSAIVAFSRLARQTSRVLRATVEVVTFDDTRRQELGAALTRHGFRRLEQPRNYSQTVVIDLRPDEESIFASLAKKARRDLRAVEKLPVEVRLIDNPQYSARMNDLLNETMTRTGGLPRTHDWESRIELSRAEPRLSRLVGLFHLDKKGPEGLLAFAWGCHHGDHAHYDIAASTRPPEFKAPLAYSPLWNLICWAKEEGASLFDLGGITPGDLASDDPLGGISDFKRWFSKVVVHAGDDWVLEPLPIRAKVAQMISDGARAFQGHRKRTQ